MALLCIGGVCVPYSAIIPLCLLGFKWAFTKLYVWGMIPQFLAELLNLNKNSVSAAAVGSACCDTQTIANGEKQEQDSKKRGKRGKQQKSSSSSSSSSSSTPSIIVKEINSEKEFDDLFASTDNDNKQIVVKFTASWCKPCHAIQPFYEEKSKEFPDYDFVLVDVDDVDEIASRYDVAIMPTFLIVEGGGNGATAVTKATYRGSDKSNLDKFLKENLTTTTTATATSCTSDDADKKDK